MIDEMDENIERAAESRHKGQDYIVRYRGFCLFVCLFLVTHSSCFVCFYLMYMVYHNGLICKGKIQFCTGGKRRTDAPMHPWSEGGVGVNS